MKKTKTKSQPNRPHVTVLRQIVELIPGYLVPKLARETGADEHARTFSPWSHVVAMLYAQVSYALGLNDVCDALRLRPHQRHVARRPARNTLSHANKKRDRVASNSRKCRYQPAPGPAAAESRLFRQPHVIDSTTIQLVANCLDWQNTTAWAAAAPPAVGAGVSPPRS